MITNVTLCSIIKNSSDTLPQFFDWAISTFKEVCLVVDDTNYDDTLEMCIAFKESNKNRVKLLVNPFDNFSSQWNRSFDLSSNDWILYMGADEIMVDCNYELLISAMTRLNKSVAVFPRLNLQNSLNEYLSIGYPDYQFRLFNRQKNKMDGKAVDETLQDRSASMIFPFHIIHLGHIRPEWALIQKGSDREVFKNVDECDGPGLKEFGNNWFLERNKEFSKHTEKVRDPDALIAIHKYLKEFKV
jgi:glycosyltransferase involved in cell wall biosynthesis